MLDTKAAWRYNDNARRETTKTKGQVKTKKITKVLDRTAAWSYNKSVNRKITKTIESGNAAKERGTNYDELQDFR